MHPVPPAAFSFIPAERKKPELVIAKSKFLPSLPSVILNENCKAVVLNFLHKIQNAF